METTSQKISRIQDMLTGLYQQIIYMNEKVEKVLNHLDKTPKKKTKKKVKNAKTQ